MNLTAINQKIAPDDEFQQNLSQYPKIIFKN